MRYTDEHLTSSPDMAESLTTDVVVTGTGHSAFTMNLSKTHRHTPGDRSLWLDGPGAIELRDELTTFVGTSEGKLILDIGSDGDELSTIEGIRILLSGHTDTERRRILAYVRNREMYP